MFLTSTCFKGQDSLTKQRAFCDTLYVTTLNIMEDYKARNSKTAASGFQLELDLGVSALTEASQYQNSAHYGFFSILTKDISGKVSQYSYSLDKLPYVLDKNGNLSRFFVGCDKDVYISQAVFETPRRRVVNVKEIQVVFLDIDCYKLAWGQHRTAKEIADTFVSICDFEGIPRPSLIVFSGRGLQAKWLLQKPIPRQALPRWNAIEKVFVDKLEQYGADSQARDASRVLRLVDTVNTKSGQRCCVVYINHTASGGIERYGFDELAEIVLPKERPQKRQNERISGKESESTLPAGYGLESLHWAFLEDMRTLLRIRGGIVEGMRNRFLMQMLSYLALSNQVSLKDFYREAQFLAQKIDPSWTYHSKDFGTVYAKFKDHINGVRVEWKGLKKTPLYTPRASTLIEWFRITEEEQRQLKVIHSEKIRRELDTERKRRERGGGTMQEYNERRSQSRDFNTEAMKKLKEEGCSNRGIARELGVSEGLVRKYLKGAY